jgi:hypothetical protein
MKMNNNYWMTLSAQEFREKLVCLLKELNHPVRAFELAEIMTKEKCEYCSVQRVAQNLRELCMSNIVKREEIRSGSKKVAFAPYVDWQGNAHPASIETYPVFVAVFSLIEN